MNPGIEQLVNGIYTDGYSIIEKFFGAEEINSFLEVFQKYQNNFTEAGIGRQQDFTKAKEIRSDKILWLEKGNEENVDKSFFNVIAEVILNLNRRCFLGLNDFEFHFARYEPGTFYKRHKDVFKSNDARKISVILYLNNKWKQGDGGELKIYLPGSEITVEPKGGTLVAFESGIEHEVLLSNTNRYSITGWLKNSNSVL